MMDAKYRSLMPALMMLLYAHAAGAEDTGMEDCLLEELGNASADTTVREIHARCEALEPAGKSSAINRRLFDESVTENNPYVITAHKPNYVLPLTYNGKPNETPYMDREGALQNLEAKFQLSLKFQVANGVLGRDSLLFFAYTNQSYWQSYNSQFSSPFRETNHEPEMFVLLPQQWHLFGLRNRVIALGLVHQSNGRSGTLSRSWNRLYANFIFERDNMVLSVRPWYRLPEPAKNAPDDPHGDDNPDILDYMGYGDMRILYKNRQQTYSLMVRNPLHMPFRGAVELNWSFPLGKRLKGYVQYFNGYGESLIDYNARVNRLGIGIALTDWL
jgi:phospholipase A1